MIAFVVSPAATLPSSSAARHTEEPAGQATALTPPRLLSDQVEAGAAGSNDPSRPEVPAGVCTEARHNDRDWHQIPYSEYGSERYCCRFGVPALNVIP